MLLIKPLDYQLYMLFERLGFNFSNLVAVTIPSIIVVVLVFQAKLFIGLNIVFFVISLILAYLINFNIDFCIGLTSFYTESIWGISVTKESIVLLLSGALIPLNFFPEALRNIMYLLPFQAIYNIPLTILIGRDMEVSALLKMFGIQIFWILMLFTCSRFLYRKSIKVVTVNGG